MYYEQERYREAMDDLNKVLEDEPGNALTLYNRGLIHAQLGAYEEALDDMDRVLNINPENVLAYFNRASIFIEMGQYRNALEDYDKAIELYPDFAKAYMNRSYVKNLLGDYRSSKKDYDTAQRKVREYREKNMAEAGSFADTTKKYSALLSLDAEFAKKDFNDELLQNRDIDVKLRPLYKIVLSGEKDVVSYALSRGYENPLVTRLETQLPVGVKVVNEPVALTDEQLAHVERYAWDGNSPEQLFVRALYENDLKRFNSALAYYSGAIEASQEEARGVDALYGSFYHMNRGALRAEMIEFLSTIENNVQVLSMDDTGAARARVKDQVTRQYDYSEAIEDMKAAAQIMPGLPYVYFNLGNLYCLSAEHLASIENYTKAIEIYPYMGDAYFNRGLVLIYLKDKEKGCIDLSRAGELGVADAYGVIKKYCEENND
jgi:tetratricopeptide (TPR) repeat protein